MFSFTKMTATAVLGLSLLGALAPSASAGTAAQAAVAIEFDNGSGYQFTGNGVLVAEGWVLTAAHLVQNNPINYRVLLGDDTAKCSPQQTIGVLDRFGPGPLVPPNVNDIALLKLAGSAVLGPDVQPIGLPNPSNNYAGVTAKIVGWWRDSCTGPVDCLRDELPHTVMTNAALEAHYGAALIHDGLMGTIDGTTVVNGGAAGSGLYVNSDTVVAGILSFGTTSGSGCLLASYPTVYTRVSYYRSWIESIIHPCAPASQIYGCGVNPPGSMSVISGSPKLGTTLVLGLDNPFATQNPGALSFVFVSGSPDPGYPCGTALTGFGMDFFPPYTGELLINPAGNIKFGGAPWTGPGVPTPVNIPIPNKYAILCLDFYAQGVLIDPTYGFGGNHLIGLTEGIKLTTGN